MSQTVIIDSNNVVRVVDSGPPGPPGFGGSAPLPRQPLWIDASEYPVGGIDAVDGVEIDLHDIDPLDTTIAIRLPETEGNDVTAILTMPDRDDPNNTKYVVSAYTASGNAQLAIKVRHPVFGPFTIAGGLQTESVSALIYKTTFTGAPYQPMSGSLYLWGGSQLFLTDQGLEFGLLHTSNTEGLVDDIASIVSSDLGTTVAPAEVAKVKAALLAKLSNGNQPVNVSFAAEKNQLAIQALLRLYFLSATEQVNASRITYDNVIPESGGTLRYAGLGDTPTVQEVLDSLATP